MSPAASRLLVATARIAESERREALYDAAIEGVVDALGARRGALFLESAGASLDVPARAMGDVGRVDAERAAAAACLAAGAPGLTRADGVVLLAAPTPNVRAALVYTFDDEPEDGLALVALVARHVGCALLRAMAAETAAQAALFDDAFAGILGHDLRNPLAGILAAAQLAAMRAGDNDVLAKPLGRIQTSGRRMSRLIDQLLDFTQVRAGKAVSLFRSPVDLVLIAKSVADEVGGGLVEVVLRTPPGGEAAPAIVGEWDEPRVAHALSALLGAALRRAKGAAITLSLDDMQTEGVVIDIHDATFVDADTLHALFEPGQRADRDGLGIRLAREIVVGHGGALRAVSTPETGTSFVVTLPRA